VKLYELLGDVESEPCAFFAARGPAARLLVFVEETVNVFGSYADACI
jgi:hypothetical protein